MFYQLHSLSIDFNDSHPTLEPTGLELQDSNSPTIDIFRYIYTTTTSSLSFISPSSSTFRIIRPKLPQNPPKPLRTSLLHQYHSKPSATFTAHHYLSPSQHSIKLEGSDQRSRWSNSFWSLGDDFSNPLTSLYSSQFTQSQGKSIRLDRYKVYLVGFFDFPWPALISSE